MLSKTFFPQHPKAGEPTEFREKVLKGTKRHTCRCNYDYWKDRIATLQERQGVLSLRQWSGKPYQKHTKQEKIMDVPASIVEVQPLVIRRTLEKQEGFTEQDPKPYATNRTYSFEASVDGNPVNIAWLAANDGLTEEDFKAWFNPVFDDYAKKIQLSKESKVLEPSEITLKFAVIQFTTFRY